jgi:hypothetical protein
MPADIRPASAAPSTPLRIGRSAAAVVGGYAIFALSAVALFQLSGRDPHAPQPLWFEIVAVLYGMGFAALGGFFAARIAPNRALLHAGIMAIVLAVGAGISLAASPGAGAKWSQWAALVLMAPSAHLGGQIAMRVRRDG